MQVLVEVHYVWMELGRVFHAGNLGHVAGTFVERIGYTGCFSLITRLALIAAR
jgi:hypothetical protein